MSTGPNECGYCGTDHGSNEPCPMLDGNDGGPPYPTAEGMLGGNDLAQQLTALVSERLDRREAKRAQRKLPMKKYTLIGIYWDNHVPFLQHVEAATFVAAEHAFKDPRNDEYPYSILVVLDGWQENLNKLEAQ